MSLYHVSPTPTPLANGLAQGCKMERDLPKDAVLNYADVLHIDFRHACGS
jgi:hypothetical protein